MNQPFPASAADLLKYLDEAYPARCIGRDQSPEHAHRYAGQRELIDGLLLWHRRDTDLRADPATKILRT